MSWANSACQVLHSPPLPSPRPPELRPTCTYPRQVGRAQEVVPYVGDPIVQAVAIIFSFRPMLAQMLCQPRAGAETDNGIEPEPLPPPPPAPDNLPPRAGQLVGFQWHLGRVSE